MAISAPRDRIVTFRLSSSEFQDVASTAEMTGSRSISDFAREAVLTRVSDQRQQSERDRVRALQEGSKELIKTLLDLNEKLHEMPQPARVGLSHEIEKLDEVLMLRQRADQLANAVTNLAKNFSRGLREPARTSEDES